MALSYRARRIWTYVILLLGLPVYIVLAITLVDWAEARLGRPAWWLEFLIYVGLGVLWALPFRAVFRGVGRPDPDAPRQD